MDILVCKCGNNYEKDSWSYDFLKFRGVCSFCYMELKGIVPWQGHYVPWEYKNHAELTGDEPRVDEFHEDVNAQLPVISWSKKYTKWKVTFSSPDFGGYDSCELVWYFDKKEDIIEAMMDK